MHARGKNADDCVRLAVHPNVFADEVTIGVEVFGPDVITHDHDVIPARLTFFGQKVAPEKQWQPSHREEARCTTCARDLFGSIFSGDVE